MPANHSRSLRAGSPSQRQGRHAEVLAWRHLQHHGHQFIAHNYHCRLGEIDLVTLSGNLLIFTEVRWRTSNAYGGATASITSAKIRRIRLAASFFLSNNPQWQHHSMRFDVIAVSGSNASLNWIQGAF